MLMPRRVKHRKVMRGRMSGMAKGGHTVAFGEYGLATLEPFHQGGCPQRPGAVQRRLQADLGQVEHLPQCSGLGYPHPAHVEVEVEVRIDHPARRRGRQ
mgnify:CR=1 FL=1